VDPRVEEKHQRLAEVFRSMGRVLVAYSGGVDSTLLLKVAQDSLGSENTLAVTALSPLYPEREVMEAERVTQGLGVRHVLIESNELEIDGFSENPPNRCYFCKRELFEKLLAVSKKEGIPFVVEGSTVDDDKDHRPGRLAVQELGIRSPLKEAGFTKAEIRELSKTLELPTWDKPSFACLASRFPYGEEITPEALKRGSRGLPLQSRIQAGSGSALRTTGENRTPQRGDGTFDRQSFKGCGGDPAEKYRLPLCHARSTRISIWIDE
jgi:uncharacterized protein